MNDRIQKWLENHLVRCEYTEFGWQECHRYEFDEHEIKEFSQLIVKECVDCLNPLSRNHSMVGAAQDTIKEYFGVE